MNHVVPAARIAVIGLFLGSLASAQFEVGDIVVNHWFGSIDAVQHRHDGTRVQVFKGSTTQFVEGATVTQDGLLLMSRWGPSPGYVLFDPQGNEVKVVDVPEASGVTGDTAQFSNGDYAIVFQQADLVIVYDDGDQFVRSIGAAGMDHPFGLAIDADDRLLVSTVAPGASKIYEFDPSGQLHQTISVGFRPGDVLWAPDGTIWTIGVDDSVVRQYAADGSLLSSFPTAIAGGNSAAIAMEHTGALLVSGTEDGSIYRYDQVGQLLGSFHDGHADGGPNLMTVIPAILDDIGTNYCGPANVNSTGSPAGVRAFGADHAGGYPLELTGFDMPPGQIGYFLVSATQDFVPFAGGSQGNLCLGGGIGRFVDDVQAVDGAGELSIDVDTLAIPQPAGPVAVQSGETWNFQAWFRDKNPGTTSNYTDGVALKFF